MSRATEQRGRVCSVHVSFLIPSVDHRTETQDTPLLGVATETHSKNSLAQERQQTRGGTWEVSRHESVR